MGEFADVSVMLAVPMLMRHEGFQGMVYRDSKGILTIGYGRNLETTGVSRAEAAAMLQQDAIEARDHCASYSYFDALRNARKAALIDLCFNVGRLRYSDFVRMHEHLKRSEWWEAGEEIVQSKAHLQEPARIRELATILQTGLLAR